MATAGGDGRTGRVALALDAVLKHGLLQLLHLPLLPLALLQPTLLLWFAQMVLQGELAGGLVNLPLESQVGFQRLQLSILPRKENSLPLLLAKLFSFSTYADEVKRGFAPLYPSGSNPRPT